MVVIVTGLRPTFVTFTMVNVIPSVRGENSAVQCQHASRNWKVERGKWHAEEVGATSEAKSAQQDVVCGAL